MEDILDEINTMEEAKETIVNLVEVINDLQEGTIVEDTSYQGTSIGFIQ